MSEPKPPADPNRKDAVPEPLSSTLQHVQHVQGDQQADMDVSWNNLHDKIVRWVAEASYGEGMPPDKSKEDLTQEVLLQVFRDIAEFVVEPGASFSGWVRQITHRKLGDSWRRARAAKRGGGKTHHLGQLGDEEDPPQFADPRVERQSMLARYGELRDSLDKALEGLGGKHKQVIELRLFQGRSFAEIAPLLGYDKEVTVRSLYMRAMQRVQEVLAGFA